MCLYPREEIKIAKEPILCLKIIGKEKNYLFGLLKFWRSLLYEINKNRRFGKILTACKRLHKELDNNNPVVIKSGFHVYDNDIINHIEKFSLLCFWFRTEKHIKPALIPREAEYCFGSNGDIVANQIVVFENEKQREKYLKR